MATNRPTSTISNVGWSVTGASAHEALDDATNAPATPDLSDFIDATPGISSSLVLACGTLAADASSLTIELYVAQLADSGDFGASISARLMRNGVTIGASLVVDTHGNTISGWFSIAIPAAFVAGDAIAIRLDVADFNTPPHLAAGRVAAVYVVDTPSSSGLLLHKRRRAAK